MINQRRFSAAESETGCEIRYKETHEFSPLKVRAKRISGSAEFKELIHSSLIQLQLKSNVPMHRVDDREVLLDENAASDSQVVEPNAQVSTNIWNQYPWLILRADAQILEVAETECVPQIADENTLVS